MEWRTTSICGAFHLGLFLECAIWHRLQPDLKAFKSGRAPAFFYAYVLDAQVLSKSRSLSQASMSNGGLEAKPQKKETAMAIVHKNTGVDRQLRPPRPPRGQEKNQTRRAALQKANQ